VAGQEDHDDDAPDTTATTRPRHDDDDDGGADAKGRSGNFSTRREAASTSFRQRNGFERRINVHNDALNDNEATLTSLWTEQRGNERDKRFDHRLAWFE